MPAVRRLVVPAIGTVALVAGAWWLSQPALLRDLPDGAVIRKVTAPKPKGVRLRCDPTGLTADAPPGSPERRLEADLYRTIVTASRRLREPSQLVVEEVSIPMPQAARFREWSVAAVALAEQEPSRCSALSADRFPATAHLAPVAEIAGDWDRLASRFNGARLWFAFSRARVDDATGDAVVYYERQCRDGCSIGEWVWFRREAGGWRIAGTQWNWIQ